MEPPEPQDGGGTIAITPSPPTPNTPAFSGRRLSANRVCAGSAHGPRRGRQGAALAGRVQNVVPEDAGSLSLPALGQPSFTARKEGTQEVLVAAQRSECVSGERQGVTFLTWGPGRIEICDHDYTKVRGGAEGKGMRKISGDGQGQCGGGAGLVSALRPNPNSSSERDRLERGVMLGWRLPGRGAPAVAAASEELG